MSTDLKALAEFEKWWTTHHSIIPKTEPDNEAYLIGKEAYLAAAKQQREEFEAENERAYQTLGLSGVPRERAKSIATGIDVLTVRKDREIDALRISLKQAESARDAAVAETIERCAKVAEGGRFLHDDAPDARFGKACSSAIRALSTDVGGMVLVPREPTREQWQEFYERVWDSDEDNPTLALSKIELQRIGRAMLAAAGEKPDVGGMVLVPFKTLIDASMILIWASNQTTQERYREVSDEISNLLATAGAKA
jgi:hypothetical protein